MFEVKRCLRYRDVRDREMLEIEGCLKVVRGKEMFEVKRCSR